MARARKLTKDQHRQIAERHLLYLRLRVEAARHSLPTMAREFGVNEATIRNYLGRSVQ